jgi:hypothetical protein
MTTERKISRYSYGVVKVRQTDTVILLLDMSNMRVRLPGGAVSDVDTSEVGLKRILARQLGTKPCLVRTESIATRDYSPSTANFPFPTIEDSPEIIREELFLVDVPDTVFKPAEGFCFVTQEVANVMKWDLAPAVRWLFDSVLVLLGMDVDSFPSPLPNKPLSFDFLAHCVGVENVSETVALRV